MARSQATPPGTGPTAAATVTVSVWHNVTRDSAGRPTGYFGFTPGDQMVKVLTYHTDARGRHPEDVVKDAFAAFNDFPRDGEGQALARQYRARRLRSVSFPGNSSCCSRPCCVHCRVVWPRSSSRWLSKHASSPSPANERPRSLLASSYAR